MYPKEPVEEYDGYKALSAAIILRACIDYLELKRELWKIEGGASVTQHYVKHVNATIKRLQRFFVGGWFVTLTDDLDGQWLLEQLDILFEEAVRDNDFSNIERITQLQIS